MSRVGKRCVPNLRLDDTPLCEHRGKQRSSALNMKACRSLARSLRPCSAIRSTSHTPDARCDTWGGPVAIRRTLRGHLAARRADQHADLRLHQLRGDRRHRLLEEVAVLLQQRATHSSRFVRLCLSAIVMCFPCVDRLGRQPTSLGSRGGRRLSRPRSLRNPRYTTSIALTPRKRVRAP